jgi:hypothetical protein
MSNPSTMNCHFVSQFLTKPWEFGERQLYFYDRRHLELQQKSSRNLFARKGLNSAETEHRLNKLIETPLRRAIAELTEPGKCEKRALDDWTVFRALVLLFPFQGLRVANRLESPQDLAGLCAWPDEKVDEYAWASKQVRKFITVRSHDGCPFFYPALGYFIIPLAHAPTELPGAITVPLTARWAIASVPADVDDEQVRRLLSQGDGAVASNASVGTNADQVVVHPAIIKHSNWTDVRQHIEEMQANNLTLLQAVVDFNRTAVAAFAEAGLEAAHAFNWIATEAKKSDEA